MFNLLAKHPDMKCHVSDLNSDLILAYLAIRDKVTEVIESLENHAKKYQKKPKPILLSDQGIRTNLSDRKSIKIDFSK